MKNPIPLSTTIQFNSVTINKLANQAIFFKYSGEIIRQLTFNENTKEKSEIKEENTLF